MTSKQMCLLLGATGVGKTLLLKRLQMKSDSGWKERPPKSLLYTPWVQQPDAEEAAQCCQSVLRGEGAMLAPVDFPIRLHLQFIVHGLDELGTPPSTLPTVGTNLTDLTVKKKKVTVRELGGCMGPIWPSYFKDCSSLIFMVDSANIAQISSSCIQLLSVLSAESLSNASVLILFNKRDMPCTMSLIEIKSLFRMDDIVASATQPIATLEVSAKSGEGLKEVMSWLESVTVK